MRSISHYLKFGATVTLGEFANFVSANVDRIMVGKIWGFSQLGFYSRSHLMVSVPTEIVASPVNSTLLPILTKMNDNPERKRKWIIQFYRAMLILAGTLAAALYATANDVIVLLMGSGWVKSAPLVMGLTPFLFMKPAGGVIYSVLIGVGDKKALLSWTWIGALISVTAIVASAPKGLEALVIAISIALVVRMLVSIYFVNHLLGSLAAPLLAGLAIGSLNFLGCTFVFSELRALTQEHDFHLVASVFVVGVATSGVMFFWGVSDSFVRKIFWIGYVKFRDKVSGEDNRKP